MAKTAAERQAELRARRKSQMSQINVPLADGTRLLLRTMALLNEATVQDTLEKIILKCFQDESEKRGSASVDAAMKRVAEDQSKRLDARLDNKTAHLF